MNRLHAAYVIARRDFTATVLSKTFLFFLLGPLFPLLLGGLFGSIGARVAMESQKPAIAVVAPLDEFRRLDRAREHVAEATGSSVVTLVHVFPKPDRDRQVSELLRSSDPPVLAVLVGGLNRPHLIGGSGTGERVLGELELLTSIARRADVSSGPEIALTRTREQSSGSLSRSRALTAQLGQMFLFFLTILLSGMLLSQLIEEKSNKIIEVIAAAVPIDALFLGKLFAMLAACILGIAVWGSAGAIAIATLSTGGLSALPPPAVGWPVFIAFAVIYFAMNYLLLGAVFLSIGAQASTAREVQILSMPVTFAQVLIFGLAAVAVGAPNSNAALGAAIFPLSSPLVMLARAAELPELWPHLVALAWQSLWVGLILWFGASLFRRSVLKSGPALPFWKRRPA